MLRVQWGHLCNVGGVPGGGQAGVAQVVLQIVFVLVNRTTFPPPLPQGSTLVVRMKGMRHAFRTISYVTITLTRPLMSA
jgi:hypothetical protein